MPPAPISDVTTPMGSSIGLRSVRATKSDKKQEDRTAKQRGGQQPLMVGADDQPQHVRRNQPDKANRPADGHALRR